MRTFPHPLSNFILTLSVRRPSVFLLYVPFTVYRAFVIETPKGGLFSLIEKEGNIESKETY